MVGIAEGNFANLGMCIFIPTINLHVINVMTLLKMKISWSFIKKICIHNPVQNNKRKILKKKYKKKMKLIMKTSTLKMFLIKYHLNKLLYMLKMKKINQKHSETELNVSFI